MFIDLIEIIDPLCLFVCSILLTYVDVRENSDCWALYKLKIFPSCTSRKR